MIGHAFFAVRDDYRRGWLAKYTFVKNGLSAIRTVRDGLGLAKIFKTEKEAERAASLALCRSLDARDRLSKKRETTLAHRVFGGAKNG